MKKVLKIDKDGYFIEDILIEDNESVPKDCIGTICVEGFYMPKWNGTTWIEGGIIPTKTIEEEKQNKIIELSDTCNQTITNGFYSDADGTNKLYDFELENQINMMGLQVKASKGETISYYAKGENCHDYTSVQFLKLIDDSVTFKFNTIEKYKNVLKPKVMACTTIEEINAITFDSV